MVRVEASVPGFIRTLADVSTVPPAFSPTHIYVPLSDTATFGSRSLKQIVTLCHKASADRKFYADDVNRSATCLLPQPMFRI